MGHIDGLSGVNIQRLKLPEAASRAKKSKSNVSPAFRDPGNFA